MVNITFLEMRKSFDEQERTYLMPPQTHEFLALNPLYSAFNFRV